MRAAGAHQDDAFKDGCVKCSLLRVCECVILKKNNILATPRFPPIPVWWVHPWMDALACRRPTCVWTGWTRRAVGSSTAHPSLLLSLLLFLFLLLSLLLLSFAFSFLPSDVPLHVQGQVVRPRETPAERDEEMMSELFIWHLKLEYTWKNTDRISSALVWKLSRCSSKWDTGEKRRNLKTFYVQIKMKKQLRQTYATDNLMTC